MVGSNIRAEAISLMDKRAAIEVEIGAITDRLTAPGGPGLRGNLIDKDGFPRDDVDIPRVRADRHRLAVLHNDHKDLTRQIERIIYELHALGPLPKAKDGSSLPAKRNAEGEEVKAAPVQVASPIQAAEAPAPPQASQLPPPTLGSAPYAMDVDAQSDKTLRPFAVIDQVTSASPAEIDGIQLGDQLLEFGSVTAGPECIQQVARELQNNAGQKVIVRLLRRGQRMQLEVTPRQWSGRGLLGCHLQPLRQA